MRRVTTIQGVSQARRLPRLGKIRLGVRVKKAKRDSRCKHDPSGMCNYCTYPRETPHFVVPSEVAKVYGEEPLALDIMLPVDEPEVVFPQAYEYYGSGRGLKCTGDGRTAYRYNEKTKQMDAVECPCPLLDQGLCGMRGHLAVILPKVSVGGVYQIDTGSHNSIIDLNSSLDYVRALIGRFAMVPLKLKREPRETHHDGQRQIHYIMRVELEGDIEFVNQLRENTKRVLAGPTFALPAPEMVNPELAEPVIAEEGENLNAAKDQPAAPPDPTPTATSAVSSDGDKGEARAAVPTLNEAHQEILKKDSAQEAADYFNTLPPSHQKVLRVVFRQHVATMSGGRGATA